MRLTLVLVALAALLGPARVTVFGTRVSVWAAYVDPKVVAALWAYDSACSAPAALPEPGHGWRAVHWFAANLVEAGDDSAAVVDPKKGIGSGDLGFWEGDSIFLDTGMVRHAAPWYLRRVLAHELEHQLLQMRHPVNPRPTVAILGLPPLPEPDTAHPDFPFQHPCQLSSWDRPLPRDSVSAP